jgi:hypothetical protein
VDTETLCRNLESSNPQVKYGSSKALLHISEVAPEDLYPRFEFFASLLDGDNTVLRWNAARIIGNLAAADNSGKIDSLLDHFFAPIRGKEMIGAANTMQGGAAIAKSKPHLAGRITKEILKVSRARYATPMCRDIAIGHAIQALDQFFDSIPDPKPVLTFVKRQLDNPRPATRKKAERFLRKHK